MVWFADVFQKPKEFFDEEKGKAEYQRAVLNYLAPLLIVGLVLLLLSTALLPLFATMPNGAAIAGLIGAGGIIVFLMVVVGGLIGIAVFNAIILAAAKLLGGKGTFKEQFYAMSVFYLAEIILSILVMIVGFILMLIPAVGIILYMLAYLAFIIIVLRAFVVMLREVHQTTTLKAIAIIIIYAVIVGVLAFLLIGTLLASVMSTAGAYPTR